MNKKVSEMYTVYIKCTRCIYKNCVKMIEVLYSNCLLSAVTSGFTFMSFQISFFNKLMKINHFYFYVRVD